jgi:poly-gamma-glutamate synthesis protein (capsule biosynthesis protein)
VPFVAVAEALRAADLTVGSLDGALSDASPPAACPLGMNLIGPARMVEGLTFAGFDVISVATNHAKDCGQHGWGCDNDSFLDTLANLEAAGIRAAGGGRTLAEALAPVFVEAAGTRFAFLAATEPGPETWATAHTPGTAPLSAEALPALLAAVSAARAEADVVIVLAQWGEEYAEAPTNNQRQWATSLVDAGAALVVGNHPHVVQAVETFPGGALAAYALGNFVFDQRRGPTSEGVVLEATFTGPSLTAWQLLPIRIHDLHQPRWAEAEAAAAILSRVEAASTAMPKR